MNQPFHVPDSQQMEPFLAQADCVKPRISYPEHLERLLALYNSEHLLKVQAREKNRTEMKEK